MLKEKLPVKSHLAEEEGSILDDGVKLPSFGQAVGCFEHCLTNSIDRPWAFLTFFNGTMSGINRLYLVRRYLLISILVRLVDMMLRGVGQVVFVNNPVSGLFILLAIVIREPYMGLLGSIALVVGTITALIILEDRSTIHVGLYGFNPILVGCAAGAMLADWTPGIVLTILGAIVVTYFQVAIGSATDKALGIPVFTAPFVFITMTLILGSYSWRRVDLTESVASPALVVHNPDTLNGYGDWGLEKVLVSIATGVSEIFLVNDWIAGVIMIAAFAICSRVLAVCAVLGSSIGLVLAFALGADSDAAYAGLWGFNPALVMMGTALFFRLTLVTACVALWGAVLAFALQSAMATAASPIGTPVLTLPFVLALSMIWLASYNLNGLDLLPSELVSTPEASMTFAQPTKIAALLESFFGGFTTVGEPEEDGYRDEEAGIELSSVEGDCLTDPPESSSDE